MSNLAKFLHEIAAGVGDVAERIDSDHVSKEDNIRSGALRSHYGQLVAVADAVRPDGTVDWTAVEDGLAIDLEPEPERESGGPAIVAGRLRLPTADGYEWHDLAAVRGALGNCTSPSEPAYTVFGIYLEPVSPCAPVDERLQSYATTVYTHGGPEAATSIAQRVCREDNRAETGEDLLQIVAVIAGEHDVLA